MNVLEALQPPSISLLPVETANAYRTRMGSEYVKLAAAMVKTAYEVSGKQGEWGHRLFTALLNNPEATTGNLKIASVAMIAVGKTLRWEEDHTKLAGMLSAAADLLKGVIVPGKALTAEALRSLMYVGGAGGAVLGGSAWGLNRALSKEDDKLRGLEIQRDTYRRLTSEVEEELKRRGMAPTPANQAAAVDYLT